MASQHSVNISTPGLPYRQHKGQEARGAGAPGRRVEPRRIPSTASPRRPHRYQDAVGADENVDEASGVEDVPK